MDAPVNALLAPWTGEHGLPPFPQFRPSDFAPAYAKAMHEHREELAAIAAQAPAPDFANTIAAFDRAGQRLADIDAVFDALAASATSPELQAVQRDLAAPLAAHWNAVYQDGRLFERVDALHRQRAVLGLTGAQQRLLERLHLAFVRAGAQLPPSQRERFAQIQERLAELQTQFAQNVLHDEAQPALVLHAEAELAGLPADLRAAARQAARERGLPDGAHAVTTARSMVVPFLTFSERRDLREQAWRAWVSRGEHDGAHDNRPLAREILALRRELAALLGYASFADYATADAMAGSPQRVWALLDEVWPRALAALELERARLLAVQREDGVDEAIEAWDWRFWAERVRQRQEALDEAELKNYFALPAMVAAAFDVAQRLFGLTFTPRPDLAGYHPDVKVYAVRGADGRDHGLFLQDNFARTNKRSGAWMSSLRLQHRNGQAMTPLVLNNNNFTRGGDGQPTLLSLDDVRTLFHEFGHGLHGLLSDVDYVRQSGTNVLRDFVELPSQLMEHWALEPSVLARHARHWRTGEPLPEAMRQRIESAERFGQAYETVRFCASAIVDLAAHQAPELIDDIVAFERRVLAERGAPAAAGMNHRLPNFQHLFAGAYYAAGYYVYLWAEVLDADAFEAFTEAGNAFDPALAQRLQRHVYGSGDSVEPGATYRAFRGRDPDPAALLRKKALV